MKEVRITQGLDIGGDVPILGVHQHLDSFLHRQSVDIHDGEKFDDLQGDSNSVLGMHEIRFAPAGHQSLSVDQSLVSLWQ